MVPTNPVGKKDWTPPLVFAEYQLLWLLGRGGMGEVYLGHDKLLDRPVAIKFISTVAPDDKMKEQYLTEARAAARLQHPNVVTVHRVGEIDGRLYIVSEYVRGQTLESVQKPLPWQQALELSIGLARGLAEAHRRGVLHRDLKPGNAILADNGEIKLLDFGLAKCIEWSGQLPVPPSHVEINEETVAPTIDITDPASIARAASISNEAGLKKQQQAIAAGNPVGMGHALRVDRPRPGERILRNLPEQGLSSGGFRRMAIASSIKGTPMYMAPEVLTGLAATRRSDVYSIGALLFELCAGVPPNYDVPIEQLQSVVPSRESPPVGHIAPSVEPRFAAVIDRCLRRNPAERFASGEQLLDALLVLLPSAAETVPEGNPYRGLWPFEDEHRSLFFGRRGEIGTLLERLRSEPCVAIAGESGIGKTSLCRAGLLPLVRDGLLEGGRSWRVATVALGRQPLRALLTALVGVIPVEEAPFQQQILRDPSSLATEISTLLPPGVGLLIFVDHLEEIISSNAAADEARLVATALASLLARSPNLRMLMAVRSDQVARVAALPGFGEALQGCLYVLRPLSAERLRETILGPAQAKGSHFESLETVNSLVDSSASSDGGLPLLQLALAELWEAREGSTITPTALEAIGGLSGAIARHADHVIGSMLADKRLLARRLLCAMVGISGQVRSCYEPELLRFDPSVPMVLETLVRSRILFVRSTADGVTYELAHGLLATNWPTLQRWLIEPTTGAGIKSPVELQSGSMPQLPSIGVRLRTIRLWILIAVAFVATATYVGFELRANRIQQKRAAGYVQQGQRELTVARSLQAELLLLRGQAFSAFDAGKSDEVDQLLARAHTAALAADRAYGRASHQLETALSIDGGRVDIRATLADILYERALAAEADHQESLLEDLLQRLALYDDSGQRRQLWSRPAHLSLRSLPESSAVQVSRCATDMQKRWSVVTTWSLGSTPLAGIELEPGPYVFILSSPGYETLRLPIVIGRGAELERNLTLTKAVGIP